MIRIVSYCRCSEPEPVGFIKINENDEFVFAMCMRCGKSYRFPWNIWYGVTPEDIYL